MSELHKMVDGVKVPLSEHDLRQREIDEAAVQEERLLYENDKYKRDRKKHYNSELGDAFEQIDFACEHGIDALALKRKDIKNRFPKK